MKRYVKADEYGFDAEYAEKAYGKDGYYTRLSQELRRKLTAVKEMLEFKGIVNIKDYEYRFQKVIENLYGTNWWDVTDCNIFETLLETGSADDTIDCIIAKLR